MPACSRILLPWDSQPQDRVEVDPDIAGRALGVWLPGQGNIAHLQRSGGLLRSDLAAPSVGSDGWVYQTTNTTAQRWVLDSTSSWVPTSGGFSLILRVKFGATIGTGRGFGVRIDGGAAAKRGSINIETGVVILDYGGFGAGSTRLSVATSQTNGTSATFVATTGPRGMEMWRDGVLIGSNAANPTRTSDAAMAFALGDLYGGTAGDSEYAVAAAIGAQLEPGLARKYSENWLTIFAPRSIWVPVSAVGGGASSITAAAGASTASTLAATATAASTPTAAAGTATASTVAASSTAASAITSATGAATASTLTGSAVVAGAITVAAGVEAGGTLVGTGLTAGASAITPADGTATTSTLTGSSVAASAITPAAGTATGQTLVSAGSISAASMTSASGSSTTATFAASAVAASVAVAAAGVSSAQVIAATAQAVAAITAAAGVTTAATMASPAGALSNAEMRELYDWVKELHRIHGLTSGVDLVVTPTSRTAGAISQTISEVGTTVTVTRP